MAIDPKTIDGQIQCLARLTGAPDSFVEQVRTLFLNKGFSLEEEAAPYLNALEEAFRREEMIRRSTGRAKKSLSRLQKQFDRIGEAYRKQLGQLRELRSASGGYSTKYATTPAKPSKPGKTSRLLIATDRPAVVTRTQRDSISMVPGPEELQ